jgi:hypothetical protein
MDEKMRVFYLGGNAGMATLSADKSSSTFDDDDARHKRLKPR